MKKITLSFFLVIIWYSIRCQQINFDIMDPSNGNNFCISLKDKMQLDVHLAVITADASILAWNESDFKNEVDILNQYFLRENGDAPITFRYKSYHTYSDILSENACPDLVSLGDNTVYDGVQFRTRYLNCSTPFLRDPNAINFFIYDSFSSSQGASDNTCHGGYTNNYPWVLIDKIRVNHHLQSPEEHEMGHSFGLEHVCNPTATINTSTNIMATSDTYPNSNGTIVDCPGSGGKRDLGFTESQTATILEFAEAHLDNLFPTFNDQTAVTFENLSGSQNVLWEFGDGASSGMSNPVHTYATTGAFKVCLTETASNNKLCKYLFVGRQCKADFSVSAVNNQLVFEAIDNNGINYWNWTINAQNKSKSNSTSISNVGLPTLIPAQLTVSNYCNSDTICKLVKTVPNNLIHSLQPSACNGDTVELITIPGYHYAWNTGGDADKTRIWETGTYMVTITDDAGCSISDSLFIQFPNQPPLVLSLNTTSLSTGFCQSAVLVTGGVTPYSYIWSNGETTNPALSLPNGDFFVTATDAVGCMITGVGNCMSVGTSDIKELAAFLVIPNPSSGIFNIQAVFTKNVVAEISVRDALGRKMHSTAVDGSSFTQTLDLSHLSKGVYFLSLINSENQVLTTTILID